ncbi:hypothetical protein [Rheinheimera maricola]|uniref:Uncharacterized protein n=1 Tax=Rheinheimera maricola TaxID=2793282 RepID=A0ABS7XCQ9_9GAMM|nr:hypothetical protein [Rheinheimera maricola]MBZ9612965.1 hypothetical protein [Rheinheimera maricola]
MEPVNDKEIVATQNGRRKFLLRAGLGSLPVLLTLNSKAAWGTSTLNCSLSENASQMQSVQPDKFEQCKKSLDSHGSAKKYFENVSSKVAGGKGGFFYKPSGTKLRHWDKQWEHIKIYQGTKFNEVFKGGYSGTLKDAVHQGGDYDLIRNITSSFLHALYYDMNNESSNFPSPREIVDAYDKSVTSEQKKQLSALLVYYIEGNG